MRRPHAPPSCAALMRRPLPRVYAPGMDPTPAVDPIVYVVQTAVSVLFAVVPAQHRHYVEALVLALIAAQVVASVLVSRLPLASLSHPRWGGILRVLHRFGHMRFRDELGTLKAPGAPVHAPSAARVDALRRAVERLDAATREDPAVTVNTSTPTPAPEAPAPEAPAPAPEHTP